MIINDELGRKWRRPWPVSLFYAGVSLENVRKPMKISQVTPRDKNIDPVSLFCILIRISGTCDCQLTPAVYYCQQEPRVRCSRSSFL